MTAPTLRQNVDSRARVLIISMFFAPCREVGGKRFSFLSQHLARGFDDYHILARRERDGFEDQTAFRGNVHRTGMIPYFPPRRRYGIWRKIARLWDKWLCQVDPYIGWVVPATLKGIRLCRKHCLDVVVVTIPVFSSIIVAVAVSRITSSKLVIDYRDEWTNHLSRKYRRPFGKYISRVLERAAIKQASVVVLCTDVMYRDFIKAFSDIAPCHLEVIYNGYEEFKDISVALPHSASTNMVYAGNFYGSRKLSVIAPALKELLDSGVISTKSFRLHLYSSLMSDDHATIASSGIADIVEVHQPVPYHTIQGILRSSDILFLPSGDEVHYAVPFKFFDYLSVRRPILAIAPRESSVHDLMTKVDCGVFAEFGHHDQIVLAIKTLLRRNKEFTFEGAERFKWSNAANQYVEIVSRIANLENSGDTTRK